MKSHSGKSMINARNNLKYIYIYIYSYIVNIDTYIHIRAISIGLPS